MCGHDRAGARNPLRLHCDLIGLGIARAADQMFIPGSKFHEADVVQQGDDLSRLRPSQRSTAPTCPTAAVDGRIDVEFRFASTGVVGECQADLLAEGWSAAFGVDLDLLAQPEHIQQVAFGQFQAALWRAFGSFEPARQRHALMYRTIAGGILLDGSRFCPEARDALILAARAQVDEADRLAGRQDIVQDVHDAYTYVFLLHTVRDSAFDESVRGVCDCTSPDDVPLRCVRMGSAGSTRRGSARDRTEFR